MTWNPVTNRVGSNSMVPQNEESRRGHSEKDEIDSNFEIQNLTVCTGTGDEDRGEPLYDNRSDWRLGFSKQFAHALEEKPVSRHRIVHARSSEHALAKETKRRNRDCRRDPPCAAFAERDADKIRCRRCRRIESSRSE